LGIVLVLFQFRISVGTESNIGIKVSYLSEFEFHHLHKVE